MQNESWHCLDLITMDFSWKTSSWCLYNPNICLHINSTTTPWQTFASVANESLDGSGGWWKHFEVGLWHTDTINQTVRLIWTQLLYLQFSSQTDIGVEIVQSLPLSRNWKLRHYRLRDQLWFYQLGATEKSPISVQIWGRWLAKFYVTSWIYLYLESGFD